MPDVRSCPHCGEPIAVESTSIEERRAVADDARPPEQADPVSEADLPPVPLLAPGSHDDDFIIPSSSSAIIPAEPDPLLGPFVTPASSSAASTIFEPPGSARSGEGFPAIDFGSGVGPAKAARPSEPEEDEPEGKRTSWATVLLASYASAITIGLAWTLMQERRREKVEVETSRAASGTGEESARQAGLSRKVEPPEPIFGERFAAMGKPLRVGDLEVTPVDVRRQPITLERSTPYSKPDRKAGGKGALVLRLKLRNTSGDAVFAPLDQAYVRERGKDIVDTFVETADGEFIYPYPLAIESEWSIVGQEFTELRPGESRVVAIASAPDAPPDDEGPFTWRVRLRTGINRTDAIGIVWPEDLPAIPTNEK